MAGAESSAQQRLRPPPPTIRNVLRPPTEQRFPYTMDYTFTNFVVGSSNQFAHAAALAVAKQPADAYNPLVLYGGPGVGKTHLLHAIGHYIGQQHPTWQVVYLPAEEFMRDLLRALHQERMESFQQRYRQADVWLIDNLQFIAGRERTQEAFLQIFEALYETHKQIVLASDKSPQEMALLAPRLRSRLSAGLIADLQPPDLETRLAILDKKATQYGIVLPPDAAMQVASRIRMNVHDLEHCLARIATHVSLHACSIDTAVVETVLQQVLAERERAVTAPRIQQTVAEHFGLKPSELRSRRRQRAVVFPRQVAMFLCRELTDASLPEIGRHFGGRDHTTVLHSCTKIARMEESDESVARLLWQLRRTLEN
ncbi:MAG: chromosomal replication initiator protein DnaA [candidate division KSB1 bacterium]|nr:chromosomal replication initiator protein DnaA [candidate division KSB1 bacterium]